MLRVLVSVQVRSSPATAVMVKLVPLPLGVCPPVRRVGAGVGGRVVRQQCAGRTRFAERVDRTERAGAQRRRAIGGGAAAGGGDRGRTAGAGDGERELVGRDEAAARQRFLQTQDRQFGVGEGAGEADAGADLGTGEGVGAAGQAADSVALAALTQVAPVNCQPAGKVFSLMVTAVVGETMV